MSRYIDADKIEGWFESISFGEIIMKCDFDNTPTADVIHIPQGATNGDMIMTMFDVKDNQIVLDGNTIHVYANGWWLHLDYKDWWNAPYRKAE